MSAIKINNQSPLTYAQLVEVNGMLAETYKSALNFKSELDAMNWTGKHADHIKALYAMVVDYHCKLLLASVELNYAIFDFDKIYNDFENATAYQSIKAII